MDRTYRCSGCFWYHRTNWLYWCNRLDWANWCGRRIWNHRANWRGRCVWNDRANWRGRCVWNHRANWSNRPSWNRLHRFNGYHGSYRYSRCQRNKRRSHLLHELRTIQYAHSLDRRPTTNHHRAEHAGSHQYHLCAYADHQHESAGLNP